LPQGKARAEPDRDDEERANLTGWLSALPVYPVVRLVAGFPENWSRDQPDDGDCPAIACCFGLVPW